MRLPHRAYADRMNRLTRSVLGAALLLAPLAILMLMLAATPPPLVFVPAYDVLIYERYASQLLAGATPYRDFNLEYPPLALLPMALPRLVWPFGALDDLGFIWLFTLVEGVLACVIGWLISRVSETPGRSVAAWVVLVLTCATPLAWRYDLWPAALVLAAVIAADRGRPGVAGVSIAAGVMLKAFPIVVLPVLAVRAIVLREWAGLVRLIGGAAVGIIVILGASLLVAGPSGFGWVSYELDRGLQIESTAAGLLMLVHVVAGTPAATAPGFGSIQLVTPGADQVVALTLGALTILTVFAQIAVLGIAARGFGRDRATLRRVPLTSLAAATAAIIIALIATSKVFSVQYIVWFMPLVPLLAWPKWLLAAAIAALSALVYPANYTALWLLDPTAIAVLTIRNLALIGLLVWLLADLLKRAREGNPAEASDPAWRRTGRSNPMATA